MQQESDFIVQLMPLLVFWLVFALPVYMIAKRKGVSTGGIILGLVIGLIPLGMVPVGIWWASLTDKALLDRISQLEVKLGAR